MTPVERRLRAQKAVNTSWGNTPDRAARTRNGHLAAEARFVKLALEKNPELTGRALTLAAESLRKAFFAGIQLKSAQARAARKAADSK